MLVKDQMTTCNLKGFTHEPKNNYHLTIQFTCGAFEQLLTCFGFTYYGSLSPLSSASFLGAAGSCSQ